MQGQERDSGAERQERVLSPASSGQAPASWPLLGEAQAKKGLALESALNKTKSGRML